MLKIISSPNRVQYDEVPVNMTQLAYMSIDQLNGKLYKIEKLIKDTLKEITEDE